MRIVRSPGVYRPEGDTHLLLRSYREAGIPPGGRTLDIGTGTGTLAIAAGRHGAADVTAVDLSALAIATTRLNALRNRTPIRVRRGDALQLTYPEPFDLVLANPPYVPAPHQPPRARTRAWNGGPDGRHCIDRICDRAPDLLTSGGTLLMVHSSLCDPDTTLQRLRDNGIKAAIVDRRPQPFGPVLHAQAPELERTGHIRPGQRHEELVVVRGDRTR